MRIGDRVVNDDSRCYVIAEIGHNHQGSMEQCRRLFDVAKDVGVSAVKLQKRDNRSLYTTEMFHMPYNSENSFGATYGEHREYLEFGHDEYAELKTHAENLGLDFFATAFDVPSVDFLEEIDLPLYKVASADIRNVPLLRRLAKTGKPIIVSTGGANMASVQFAHNTLAAGTGPIGILQCTAGYPAAWQELNLRVIETYREAFPDAVVGLSSHDNGIAMATAGFVLGARIVEKHFTLDRTMRGTDHSFSLEPAGMRKMVRDLARVRDALGNGEKCVYESERAPILKMSKSPVAAHDLPAGHVLGPEDIALKSPGDGLAASEYDALLGGRLSRPLKAETPLLFEALELAEVIEESAELHVH